MVVDGVRAGDSQDIGHDAIGIDERAEDPMGDKQPSLGKRIFYSSLIALNECFPVLESIPYTLFDAQSDRVWEIEAEYSRAGGGQWLPATEGAVAVTSLGPTSLQLARQRGPRRPTTS